jgi:hypothetical protein
MKWYYKFAIAFVIIFGIAATGVHGPFTIRDATPYLIFQDTNNDDFKITADAGIITITNQSAGGGTVKYIWRFDASGNLYIDSGGFLTSNAAVTAGYVGLYEDSDNGTNLVTFIAPASVASDRTITLPDATGTVQLLGSLPMSAGLFTPGTSDDEIPFTIDAPATDTITSVSCYSWDGTTTINVTNGSDFGATDVTDSGGLECGKDTVTSDTTLTNTTITAGNVVAFDISAIDTAPSRLFVEIK